MQAHNPRGNPAWVPGGPSANPNGRPTKERSMTFILGNVGDEIASINDGTLSGKQLLAKRVWEGLSTGTITLTDEKRLTLGAADWKDLARWVYMQVDGPPVPEKEKKDIVGGDVPFTIPADLLTSSFLDVYRDIRMKRHTEYIFSGGRGSTKSTFVSEALITTLIANPGIHAVVTRQVADTMRGSVFSQLQWAINELGLSDKFKCTTSPLEIEYIPTRQRIYFRGGDDPGKMKSIRPPFGYIGILWFEELDQFRGPDAVRKIEQSVIRGGEEAYIFKSFNPPRTSGNWANKYLTVPKATQYQHRSNYLTVPSEWLGQTFIEEAEHLQNVNPAAYDHEYMGVVNGMGGQVFTNLTLRRIEDEEVNQFDRVLTGCDWGYFPDPFAFVKCYYNPNQLRLYIYDEFCARRKANKVVFDELMASGKLTKDQLLIADSSEPKSVSDFREYGSTCRGAEKGPDSVVYSMKWLQSLREIVIDPARCPESAQEFNDYELEKDKDGEFISEYPDANNHFIDASRYATNLIWRRRGQ